MDGWLTVPAGRQGVPMATRVVVAARLQCPAWDALQGPNLYGDYGVKRSLILLSLAR